MACCRLLTLVMGTCSSLNSVNTMPELNLTQQSSAILDLYLRETRSGKSEGYRDYMVFENLFKMFSVHMKT